MTVLILAAIVALVGSHLLTRSSQEVRLATRSYYMNAAMNLAEAGAEEAIWSANNAYFGSAYLGSTYGWSSAADGSGALVKSVTTGLALAQGTGEIHLRIDNPASGQPVIYSLGVVRLPGQRPIVKQLRVSLVRRALWPNAIVAKGNVTFKGNQVRVDAYDSSVGPWHATTNRIDKGTVATNVATTGGLSINNADVYGAVATGGAQPVVGAAGSITGATTPSGVAIDSSRVRTDFAYNIMDTILPSAPPTALAGIAGALTLPRAGDPVAPNGRYVYRTDEIDLNNQVLTISGPVDLIVTSNVRVTGGSGGIVVNSGGTGSLHMYVAGDLTLSGQGGINYTNQPTNMMFYGTRTTAAAAVGGPQQFSLSGNSAYTGVVYAPNAAITLSGSGSSGEFNGAVIGSTVLFNGNYAFHYDVQLLTFLSDQSFRASSWIELTESPASGHALARDSRQPFTSLF